MRKIFSEYGLVAVSMVAGIIGISLFANALFSNDISLFLILKNWAHRLI